MTNDKDLIRFQHMLDSATAILAFVKGKIFRSEGLPWYSPGRKAWVRMQNEYLSPAGGDIRQRNFYVATYGA